MLGRCVTAVRCSGLGTPAVALSWLCADAMSASSVRAEPKSPSATTAAPATPLTPETAQPPVIVLSGGPCGGKTTSLRTVSQALEDVGWDVYVVPEVPTLITQAGAVYPGVDGGAELLAFESALLRLQLQFEDGLKGVAVTTGRPSVLLCDRGAMDPSAYMPRETWLAICADNGWDEAMFFDRYSFVVHLVTAADGAAEFYTLSNNTARTETVEEACRQDRLVREAWSKHPRHVVVDNTTGFDAKMQAVVKHISGFVGKPPTA